MKKALYALLAIAIIGAIAFGVSNSNLLKGSGFEVATIQTEDGDDGDGDEDFTIDGTDGGTKTIPGGEWTPGGGGGTVPTDPGGGGTTSCDSEYYLDIYVQDVAENDLTDLDEDDFTIKTSGGTDVSSYFSFDDAQSNYGGYDFDLLSGSAASSYEVTVNPSGYKSATVEVTTNDTCSDYRTGMVITLDYNHSITVYDHEGRETGEASVRTGTSYATECDYWNAQSKYVCTTPDASVDQYRVSLTGYVNKTGNFSDTTTGDATWTGSMGLGETYDIDDLGDVWGVTTTTWDREDLMGIEIDPTWGMENIPSNWDYDQYTDVTYWEDTNVFVDEFYGTGNTDEYYTEAIDFYETILTGTDLVQFETNAGYHDFLINSYVNAYQTTPAYQASMAETYNQGGIDYSSYASMAQYSSIYQGYTNYRTSFWNFNPMVGLTSLLAASGSTATGAQSAQTGIDYTTGIDAYTPGSSSYSTEYSEASGDESDHKDVTMSQFAWSFAIYDKSTGEAITNANATITASSTTSDCDHTENGIYWCSETSYFSSTGKKPSYEISATGYDSESGDFSEARTSRISDPVVEVIYLSTTDTTDPASYCDTIDISSASLPLAYDATEVGSIDLEVEVIASNSDYAETIELSVIGGTLDAYTAEVSGTSSYPTFTWTDAAIGDVVTVTSDYCDSSYIEITQDDAPADDGSEEYELTCSDADITPDSYEIYLSASDDYQHQFKLEWTTVNQLIALQEAPEWIQSAFAVKNEINPLLQLAEEDDGSITFTIATTGNGDLYYAEDLNTAYTELSYNSTTEENETVIFYYSNADGGDALYVTSSDNNCSDSVTLTEEEEEEVEEEEEEEEIDFEEIEDIDACDEYPFTDVDDDDDLATYIYCLAQTGAVQGYGDGSYGPGNNITNAELVKIVVAMTGAPLASTSDPTDFLDIEGHWSERYVKTAEALDIARSRENVYFSPDSPATRGYLVTLLARGAEKTLWGWSASDIEATDVSTSDYYAYALILAMDAYGDVPGIGEEAIVQGYSDGSFKGQNNIRRDEAAAMLIRAFYAWYL